MTDREVVLGSGAAPGPRRRRVREFVGNRSYPTKLGALGAALVLATAPFGGLKSAPAQDVEPLALGQRIDIGPFYLTFKTVKQVSDLQPAISPQAAGAKLLVLTVEVTNHTDRAEYSRLAVQAIGGDHTGGMPWEGDEGILAKVFSVDDASPFEEFVNPGQTYTLALVLQQDPETDLGRVEFTVYGYFFQAVDPQTLDPDRWVPDDVPLATGHVPVEVEK